MWWIGFFLFLLSLGQVVISVGTVLHSGYLLDFHEYYRHATTFLTGGNPYQPPIPFNYPPMFLLLLSPFALLPYKTAEILFTLSSLAALVISGHLLTKPFIRLASIRFLILVVLLENFPTKFTLGMGQINLIVLLFIVGAFTLDQEGKLWKAGVSYALASIMKITPLPIGIFFLLRGKWASFIVGIVLFVVSNLVLIVARGWTSSYFLTAIPQFFLSTRNTSSPYDQSLHAFLTRLGFGSISFPLSCGLIIGCFLLFVFFYKENIVRAHYPRKLLDFHLFASVLLLITIGNTYAWHHHLVFLFPGYIVATVFVFRKRLVSLAGMLFVSALLAGYHLPVSRFSSANPFLLSHATLGALLLLGLLLFLLRPQKHPRKRSNMRIGRR